MQYAILILLTLFLGLGVSFFPEKNPRTGLIIIILSFISVISVCGFCNLSLWILPPIIIASIALGLYISKKDDSVQKLVSIFRTGKSEVIETKHKKETELPEVDFGAKNLTDKELIDEVLRRGIAVGGTE